MFWSIILALIAGVALLNARALLNFFTFIIQPYFSPLRNVKGPPSPSWVFGNTKQMQEHGDIECHEKWVAEYGPVFKRKGSLNSDRLFMLDPRAVGHVLSHVQDYQKPEQLRYNLGQLMGHGLLFVEGDQHKQQRRIMSPAFGPTQVRALTPIFVDKSLQLRDCWLALISQEVSAQSGSSTDEPRTTIDVLSWLNKTTLDIIGLAGFNHSFDALNPDEIPSELNEAVRMMFSSLHGGGRDLLVVLQTILPIFRLIPSNVGRRIVTAQATFRRIGMQLLAARKAELRTSAADNDDGAADALGRADVKGRDLLTLLVKANMASDVKEDSRMSDEDVLAQIPTFLIAGHETTSTAVTWALYALSLHPETQVALRAALPPPPTNGITMEFLQDLPELDRVVREVMRLYAPVQTTMRIATRADVIPTASEWEDQKGVRRSGIPVAAGDAVIIPILALNRSPEIWGPDAREFKYVALSHLLLCAHFRLLAATPQLQTDFLAFSGGSRACIGYRFSVFEMKALLYVLVRAFSFSLTMPPESIRTRSVIVTRPYIDGKMDEGAQMPLYVSAVREED
ncbi:cytochrome P450 monooxygenase [Auriscalpium vulgare]|uniref:Cytochrome P450 monooxygenase n=1 Tax=Auriscalpium vulgare TaxID=40419 RepID=A0ACB8R882_9AGAM|nr:cytochrome P450 monooxygenase [Auriscalpium vulgare]